MSPRMTDRRAVITGIGRSGTGYTAELLHRLGVKAGHEQVFGPRLTNDVDWTPGERNPARWDRPFPAVEVSWLAVPHLGQLAATIPIAHITRSPLAWLRSWARPLVKPEEQESAGPYRPGEYKSFAPNRWNIDGNFAPILNDAVTLPDEPLLSMYLRLWMAWNRAAAEHAHAHFCVEDLSKPAETHRLLKAIGHRASASGVQITTRALNKTTNTWGWREHDARITWNSVLPEVRREAQALAAEYGHAA